MSMVWKSSEDLRKKYVKSKNINWLFVSNLSNLKIICISFYIHFSSTCKVYVFDPGILFHIRFMWNESYNSFNLKCKLNIFLQKAEPIYLCRWIWYKKDAKSNIINRLCVFRLETKFFQLSVFWFSMLQFYFLSGWLQAL